MSKIICSSAIDGAVNWVARAEARLNEAIQLKSETAEVGFPDTAYYLPIIYSFTGEKVHCLGDLRTILKRAKTLLPSRPSESVWLPYLGHTLDAGVAALFACEIIEACKYIIGPAPVDGIWLGAASDVIMRERGIEFVDGTAPGFAAITGAAPNSAVAVKIARELQEKNLYVFMAGTTNGAQFAEQLAEQGVQLGWETRLVPFGLDVSALVYALGFANRAALSFGGVKPGDYAANLRYNKNRIFAFVLAFGEVTPEKYAAAAGAINYGFPVLADTDIPQILPTGVCTYEHVNDGEIDLIGPDIDTVAPGSALPLAIWVEVAGRKMQTDFEPILERQIHHLLNGAEGIWHMGQRDIVWTRVSKAGFDRGLRLRHYGEILHAKLLSDYPAIVDKVKVTIITERDEVEARVKIARRVYDERNRRLEAMTDESVETFYSCLLCQSFAPNHVCIITPERLGLCGAYNWLDGKAAYEIDETGPNQPVKKGECIDPVKGVWQGIDEYVYLNSHKTVSSFSAYAIMDRPMTSCGCFEVICAYVPECNGIMAVNREFLGDTPVGMTFSTLAGSVGGGQQTPGFMGCGKVFLTSRKFLFAEGGHQRLVWMTKDLKILLADDLNKRFVEQGAPDLLEKICDETIATEGHAIFEHLKKVGHPALEMEDMNHFAESHRIAPTEAPAVQLMVSDTPAATEKSASDNGKRDVIATVDLIEKVKREVTAEITKELKASITRDVVQEIIRTLSQKFLGEDVPLAGQVESTPDFAEIADLDRGQFAEKTDAPEPNRPTAAERFAGITTFDIRKERCEVPIWTVKLGATKAEGGTRGRTCVVGGATCMPFHLWEGAMPHRPVVAMEVFDAVSEKYPATLRKIYGTALNTPAEMAKLCVEKYGADLISVRLEATHPEKGNRSPEQAVQVVKSVLAAVDAPLIVTGHSHFDRNNDVMKAVAQACAGENLLLNWVEQDNYRTIAGAALAYGHTLVAQSPIDVNIAKQMNILLTNMDVKSEHIVMDPMTGAMGYGIEYTYSVMERIRLTALNGDAMLAGPMIVSPGQECARIKELRAPEAEFPAWGDLDKRAVLWELATALNLLYAGADILILYHPEAVKALKRTILRLMGGG